MSNLLTLKSLCAIFSRPLVRSAVAMGALTTLVFLCLAAPVPVNGILLLLQAQIILLLYVVLEIVFLCWNDMVDAYKLSFRYRIVLPRGNAFHRCVHALLEEAVCGSRMTAFLAEFIPWSMVVGLPALVAWWFGFAPLGSVMPFSIIAWVLASLVYLALCEIWGWQHERELPLFRTVRLDADQ